jgi:hypothetical protein
MTTEEAGAVLAACASFDRRKTGPLDVIAWYRAIGDLDFIDCERAVIAHYGETTDWIMPGHIRTRVKAKRRERIERGILAAPSAALTDNPANYRATLKADLHRLADGLSEPLAIGGPVREDGPPPTWAEARAKMGAAIDPEPGPLGPQEIARRQAAESRAARGAQHVAGEDDAA